MKGERRVVSIPNGPAPTGSRIPLGMPVIFSNNSFLGESEPTMAYNTDLLVRYDWMSTDHNKEPCGCNLMIVTVPTRTLLRNPSTKDRRWEVYVTATRSHSVKR